MIKIPMILYTGKGYVKKNPREFIQPDPLRQHNIHLKIKLKDINKTGFKYNLEKINRGQGHRIQLIPLGDGEYSLVTGEKIINPEYSHRAFSLYKGWVQSQWMFLLKYQFPLYRPGGKKYIRFEVIGRVVNSGTILFTLPEELRNEYLKGFHGPMENTYLGTKK